MECGSIHPGSLQDISDDYSNITNDLNIQLDVVKELLKSGESWSTMWIEFSQKKYPYDENFLSVSQYVKDNEI